MGKLTLHARIVAGVTVIALLGGCEQRTWTADEIREIAGDAEPYEGGNTQLTMDLEARIIALERENAFQKGMIDTLARGADETSRVDNENVGIYNDFKDSANDRLDRIEARLGI